MALVQLIVGLKYTRADLYQLLGVPEDKRGGDWATGYTRYNNAFFVFTTVGVPGRTGHDYLNYWEDDRTRLVWEAKRRTHPEQPQIRALVSGHLPVHMFTRTGDRDPFEYHGRATAESVFDTRPVMVTWVFDPATPTPVALNRVASLGATVDPATESEYLRAQRLGQSKFRADLMRRWNGRCALTQVAMPEILRASHIKAWRDSTPHERINPQNGLLLAVHIDGLFDRGFLSFGENGRTILSDAILPLTRSALALSPETQLIGLTVENHLFLEHHRKKYRAQLGVR